MNFETVKLLTNNSSHDFHSVRTVLLSATVLLLGACASQNNLQVTQPLPPLKHAGPGTQVQDPDLLTVSPAMDEFLERYVTRSVDKRTRQILLLDAVSKNGVLAFEYDAALTLSAADAFEQRTGNCMGFANMIIALARRAGLKAHYQQVYRQRDWSSQDDTLLVIKHINVVIGWDPHNSAVVDISGLNIGPNVRQYIVTDQYAEALYLNNLGVEAMLDGDLPTAYAYFDKAIAKQPEVIDTWVNVGVAFGRNGQLNDAETAFQTALRIDQNEYAAMSNLYEVYVARNDMESAAVLEDKVEEHRRDNPYYLLRLSDEAMQRQEFELATNLLRQAVKKKSNDYQLLFALARTQYLSGDTEAAENTLNRARKYVPDNMLAVYERPINEVMLEIRR